MNAASVRPRAAVGVVAAVCCAVLLAVAWAAPAPAAAAAAPRVDCGWAVTASRLLATLAQRNDPRAAGIQNRLLALGFGRDGTPPAQCAGTSAPAPTGPATSTPGSSPAAGATAGSSDDRAVPAGASGRPDEPLNGAAERNLFTPAGGGSTIPVTGGNIGAANPQPGDTVEITAGSYPGFTPKSGTSGRYVTYRAAPGAKVVISGGASGGGALDLAGASWVHLDGITVADAGGYAIQITGSDHVALTNIEVAGSQDGGMRIYDSKAIYIEGANVHGTNAKGTSAESEAVSLEKITGFEVLNSRVHDNGEEGIDIKYGSTGGSVHHNLAWGNRGPNIYLDGVTGVAVHHNWAWGATNGDKPGIMIAAEGYNGYTTVSDITVDNNTVWDNPAGSIITWSVDGGGITAANNIVDKPVQLGGAKQSGNRSGPIPQLTQALLGSGSSSSATSSAGSSAGSGAAGATPSRGSPAGPHGSPTSSSSQE